VDAQICAAIRVRQAGVLWGEVVYNDLGTALRNWQAVTLLTCEVRPGELYPAEISHAADGVAPLMLSDEGDAR